ncbi:phytoene dehydrogenase-like protein [Tamaricihabitans halophyticus]|uniref:Phytoene dehydrogenase-like protein n=1 Tax=Tamaricihabitans halophyticus TaxID=1262583 RepID=A0A4R2QND5_9PSEU|nr:NAD(P)/FAD-dependent oxidoreductase [Tamaricihabitans halophyticus]TCP50118.1 phytoene dehydrogenase-like protein [Tamaricihabitans halophyticus]
MWTSPPRPPAVEPAETADAVVIGAGPNGLVAANLLVDAGWDVLLVEAQPEPGGAVRTVRPFGPDYQFDLASAFYPLAAVSPAMRDLRLAEYGLRWCHAPAALGHVLPDDRCALLFRDIEATAASLDTFAPGDGARWRTQARRWQTVRADLLRALLTPFPPVRAGLGLAATLGVGDGLRFAQQALLSARALGERDFAGQGARLLLAGSALHTDLGPEQAGSGLFGWLLCMLAQDTGFPAPYGGAGALTTALVRRFTAKGGRLNCGRAITGVLTARGRAVGVRDAAGQLVRARQAVLADVSAPALYLDLVGPAALPPAFVADLHGFRWDDATVKVNWALSGPIPWRNPDAALAGTVHLDGDLDDLSGFSTDLACARQPARPFVLLGQMSTTDPSRSPAGTETVWAYTHVPRGVIWTTDRLRRYADRIQAIVEAHASGFGTRVRDRWIQGPGELEASDANLADGAINGGTAAPHQQLVFRPVPGLGRADTPIDRLFLASASAHPGGAVHGAPGANAARAALARAGVAGPVYAAMMRRTRRALYG